MIDGVTSVLIQVRPSFFQSPILACGVAVDPLRPPLAHCELAELRLLIATGARNRRSVCPGPLEIGFDTYTIGYIYTLISRISEPSTREVPGLCGP